MTCREWWGGVRMGEVWGRSGEKERREGLRRKGREKGEGWEAEGGGKGRIGREQEEDREGTGGGKGGQRGKGEIGVV